MSERNSDDATRDQDDFASQEDWDDNDPPEEISEFDEEDEVAELDFGYEYEDHGYRPDRSDE